MYEIHIYTYRWKLFTVLFLLINGQNFENSKHFLEIFKTNAEHFVKARKGNGVKKNFFFFGFLSLLLAHSIDTNLKSRKKTVSFYNKMIQWIKLKFWWKGIQVFCLFVCFFEILTFWIWSVKTKCFDNSFLTFTCLYLTRMNL